MGRRRRPEHTPRRRPKAWTSEHWKELLANLDFIIQEWHVQTDGRISKTLVLRKLQPRLRRPGTRRTQNDIENKLQAECRTLLGPRRTLDDVFHVGTRCLQLDGHTRLQVRDKLAAITLYERELQKDTPRKLRTASRTPVPFRGLTPSLGHLKDREPAKTPRRTPNTVIPDSFSSRVS